MSPQTTQILFLVVIVAAFYFLIIRPQQQRSKAQRDMISSLEPGAEIMTVGGIYATIVSIEDDRILAELYDGTQLELAKRAVASIIPPKAHVAEEDVDSEPEMAEAAEEPHDAEASTDGQGSDDEPSADKGDAQ